MTPAALVTLFMAAAESFSVMVSALTVFTVMMPAAFIVTMVIAFATFFVMMAMVVAHSVRIIFQRPVGQGFRGSLRRSLNACVQLYPGIRKRHLSAQPDAAADQGVSLYSLQEACKSSVAAAVGIDDLLLYDPAVFNIIQFELLGMTEVLKDLSVFVCDCDSHGMRSFLNDHLIDLDRLKFTMSACDQQPFSVHKGVGDFFPCTVINGSDRSSGNIHSGCTVFLGQVFGIQKSQCLIFVYGHSNAFSGCDVIRRETAIDRDPLYSSAFEWSWHVFPFLTYVINSIP